MRVQCLLRRFDRPKRQAFFTPLRFFSLCAPSALLYLLQEDLILVDPDFFSDYLPSPTVSFAIPRGFKVLYARGIAAADMPLVLQRAKIVLDLALPGVERLGTHPSIHPSIHPSLD